MRTPRCILIDVLLDPPSIVQLSLQDWDVLIRQARASYLMVRLATLLDEKDLLSAVPSPPGKHLEAILRLRDCQRRAVRWEVEHLALALEQAKVPLVLLKGAAYEMADLPPGRCRIFSDFDLLVSREQLDKAEIALMQHGWASAYHDAYDQRYYRTWMHELPPLRHIKRHSVVDVHHNLVPDTARLRPDPVKLLAESVPCARRDDVRVLSGRDLILHSAVHLFHDGEFDHGLRDLFDLHDLVSHFMTGPAEWDSLVSRAWELNLARPLFYAIRYLQRVLSFDVPATALEALRNAAPPAITMSFLDAVFERGLLPAHVTCRDRWAEPSRHFLYVRGHSLRMPLHLLIPHLIRKALRSMSLLPEPGPGRKVQPF